MTVEIAVAPERAMAVLARYGLTVDGKRALDAYYRERVQGAPRCRRRGTAPIRRITPGSSGRDSRD